MVIPYIGEKEVPIVFKILPRNLKKIPSVGSATILFILKNKGNFNTMAYISKNALPDGLLVLKVPIKIKFSFLRS